MVSRWKIFEELMDNRKVRPIALNKIAQSIDRGGSDRLLCSRWFLENGDRLADETRAREDKLDSKDLTNHRFYIDIDRRRSPGGSAPHSKDPPPGVSLAFLYIYRSNRKKPRPPSGDRGSIVILRLWIETAIA
jgi:hypothetical protein